MLKVYQLDNKEKVIAESLQEVAKMFPNHKAKFVDNASAFSETRKMRWSQGLFRYYQPNTKDKGNKRGDCVIRALTVFLDRSWLEIFELLVPVAREVQDCVSGDFAYTELLKRMGYAWYPVKAVRGSTRPTVESFTLEHPNGTYLLHVAGHLVSCKDGLYYDTWNCGDKSLYGWWQK